MTQRFMINQTTKIKSISALLDARWPRYRGTMAKIAEVLIKLGQGKKQF